MDKNAFLKEQFVSLREEIKETKSRIFKVLGIGLLIVPVAQFYAFTQKAPFVTLTMPILVMVISLLYLSENNALMRCGKYIRSVIEPEFPEIQGWEEWLSQPTKDFDTRRVDKYLSYCFLLLFLIYYTGSVAISIIYSLDHFGTVFSGALIGVYSAIGVWLGIFLIRNVRVDT